MKRHFAVLPDWFKKVNDKYRSPKPIHTLSSISELEDEQKMEVIDVNSNQASSSRQHTCEILDYFDSNSESVPPLDRLFETEENYENLCKEPPISTDGNILNLPVQIHEISSTM